MRVTVDLVMCEGHGVCVDVAPEIFTIGDDGRAVVLVAELTPEMVGPAGDAARRCPASAIALVA